nr:reverse transcriptase domain-containing protein [Tanacetum cinerariifolium]
MSAVADTTPLVTTVTKPATNPREADATPRVNIQDLCEEYYEDILPIIMDKVYREKQKEVHTRDHPRGRSHPHRLDTSNEDCPKHRERFRGVGESYDDSFSHSYRDGNRSRHTKRIRDNESPSSSVSKSDSSNERYRKSRSKRHKSTDEDDLTRPWMCEEEDPFTPRIQDHVKIFQATAHVEQWAMPTWCHMFNSTLIGAARVWFDELPPESIDSYKVLKEAFLAYFMQQKKYVKDPVEIHNIKQKDGETIKDFIERFKVETERMKGAPECMRISGFMHGVNNLELTKRLNEHVPKTMEEMMITTTTFIREAAAASKKKGKKETPAKDKPTAIYMIQSWQRMTRQKVTQSFERVKEIMFPPLTASSGEEGSLIIEAKMGGHMIHRMYVDGGSSMEILYEHCFNRLRPEIKNQMVSATTSLTGFSGETIWLLGQLRLLVTIGDADHSTRAWMNFMIVRSLSPYNGIIGRPGIREIQAVPSTAHRMLKFPVKGGIVTIRSTILIPTEFTLVITSSTVSKEEGIRPENFKVALHPDFLDQEVAIRGMSTTISNIREGYLPVWQKKRGQALERAKAIQIEVQKLVEAGIMREVYYHDWLSNPVMVKKYDDSWRMCVDFTYLNKACPQDCYPMPKIDWKVESLCGYPFKCFLDAYKGYHQIQLAESDEEKTAFHSGQGVYCYTKIPFGLKNAGVTYQRLVDKAFDSQIGRNIKVYVDDLVVKSYTESEMLRDIDETFRTLRKINMKLNLKKSEKSLPLFKILKKCIKKSDFHWTAEAEQAFKQLKHHLSKLLLLVAPKPKEELIIYLSATYGAISAVLMTESRATHTPIYFISRALQGLELNYTLMEKLVLSLVFAAKRLQRYFQAHPIMVITDQPIKQIMSRPDVILTDFLTEMPDENPPATPVAETQQEPWTLFPDGSSSSNNEAEYEALIAGLQIAAQMGVQNVHVLVEILTEKSIKEKEVTTVVEEDEPTWMTPIVEYVKEGTLPSDRKETRKLRIKARRRYGLLHEMDRSESSSDNHWRSERANQSLGEGIKARLGEGNKNWVEELPHLLWAHRTMIKSRHGDTPFSLTYGTEAVIPVEIRMPTYRTASVDVVYNDEELRLNLDLLEELRERAAIREAKAKFKVTKYYNARVRGVTFRPGDFVYRSNYASHAMAGGKLGPKWEGPYEVTEALGDEAYKLRSTDGTILPRTWNIANLKRCYL